MVNNKFHKSIFYSALGLIAGGFVLLSQTATSKDGTPPLKLDQKTVAQRALDVSSQSREAFLQAELAELGPYVVNGTFDSVLSLESGFQNSKFQSFTNTSLERTQSYITKLSYRKPFTTGTLLGVEYNRTSFKYDYSLGATSTVDKQTQDIAGITLEQNLWYNSFGTADRASIRASEAALQAARLGRFVDQQNVVLDSIRRFWGAYVAQENFRESLASRERYEKLVEAVHRKNNLGYAAPGELAQVQAELETRIQNVKRNSDTFLTVTNDLITFLQLEPGTEIEFSVPEELPPLPTLQETAAEDLRVLRRQKSLVSAAENNLTVSESKSWPLLNLVGKYYGSGLETLSTDSNNDVWSNAYPQYYYGLRFVFSFGSGSQSADISNKRAQISLEQTRLARIRAESVDNLQESKRKVVALHSIAESSARQKQYREKAAQELQRAYNQGRVDINQLITNLNLFFDARVAYSKAIGDYQVALQEWSAANDHLILETKPQ